MAPIGTSGPVLKATTRKFLGGGGRRQARTLDQFDNGVAHAKLRLIRDELSCDGRIPERWYRATIVTRVCIALWLAVLPYSKGVKA